MTTHKASQKRLIREKNRALREAYGQAWLESPTAYRNVFYSDEVHWGITYATENIKREPGEELSPSCIQLRKGDSHRALLHAHAFVGYNIKSRLIFYETETWPKGHPKAGKNKCGGNIPTSVYERIIQEDYAPAFEEQRRAGREMTLLEDNDWAHGTRQKNHPMNAIKRATGVTWFANIPQSPDLNIIENVWRLIKQRLKHHNHEYGNKEKLKRAILEEWDAVTQQEINDLVDTYPQRCQQLVERKGLHTDW